MKRLSVLLFSGILGAVSWANGAELTSPRAKFTFDDRTGALTSVADLKNAFTPVKAVRNSYLLQKQSGDLVSDETGDSVTSKSFADGALIYKCTNSSLPGFEITKKYSIVNNGLHRELTFRNNSAEKVYIFPFTESAFDAGYKDGGYYFGAGYLGPYMPAAKVTRPVKVDTYVQTSKGMVITNAARDNGYAHYRLKINDTVVWPWWQSAIGRYREKEDRLYYMPEGWKMCLGALDVEPNGGSIRLTDAFNLFHGGLYEFINDVYGREPDVAAALKTIEPVPEYMKNMLGSVTMASADSMRYLTDMLDDGWFYYHATLLWTWFDYRRLDSFTGWQGGIVKPEELAHFFQSISGVSPDRIISTIYTVPIGVTPGSPALKDRPEWIRMYDREGNRDILFPGMGENYQVMLNRPEARKHFIDTVTDMAHWLGNRGIYVDEAQQYNVINWQSGEVMRDDHLDALWRELRTRTRKEGLLFAMNGSGQPYGDFNYMENWVMMAPAKWREYAGIAWGLELFGMLRPGSRIVPLYWHILRENDYTNRLLALGWVPNMAYAADQYPLAPVRAAFETGNGDPVNIRYTPDWKRDPETEIESYAIRRDGGSDILLSFINRSGGNSFDIELDMQSLPYGRESRINIWRMPVGRFAQETPVNECKTGDRFFLSNTEYRKLYCKYGWQGGFVGAPELVFSGTASGKFRDSVKNIAPGHMVQYIITDGPFALYTVNDVGANYPYSHDRRLIRKGSSFDSGHGKFELLLADRDFEFTDVKANGKSLAVKNVDVGGMRFQTVTLHNGKFDLEYTGIPRKNVPAEKVTARYNADKKVIEVDGSSDSDMYALSLRDRVLYSGRAPIPVPQQHEGGTYTLRKLGAAGGTAVQLPDGQLTGVAGKKDTVWHPEKKNIAPVSVKHGEVTVSEAATYVSAWEDAYDLQRDMPVSEVAADPVRLHLRAATSPRERVSYVKHYTRNYAGFELNNARQIRIRFRPRFQGALDGGHITYCLKRPAQDFAGFTIDFRVRGKYTRRVALSAAIYNKKLANPLPVWGTGKAPDMHFDLGPIAEKPGEQTISFDMTKIAPEGWDGTAYFSVGGSNLNANRVLDAEIISFNDTAAKDFVKFSDRKHGTPDPLSLPRLHKPLDMDGILDPSRWREWAKIGGLQPLGKTRALSQQTRAWLAYDAKNLYIAAFAAETARKIQAYDQPLWKNDCLEYYFITPDKKMLQMVIDARGKMSFHVHKQNAIPTDGMTVRSRMVDGEGFWIFVAIPWQKLGIESIDPGTKIPFNLCRSRNPEYGSYGKVEKQYAESDSFGILQLGIFGSGQGRWQEIIINN